MSVIISLIPRTINTRPSVKPKNGPNFKILNIRLVLKIRPSYRVTRTNIRYRVLVYLA